MNDPCNNQIKWCVAILIAIFIIYGRLDNFYRSQDAANNVYNNPSTGCSTDIECEVMHSASDSRFWVRD
jgi:hypothetical protein